MIRNHKEFWRGVSLLVLLCALGSLAGYLAAPALARQHYSVRMAERLFAQQTRDLKNESLKEKIRLDQDKNSFEMQAVRTLGLSPNQLYDEAREVHRRFRIGSLLFGLWCGLVAGLKLLNLFVTRRGTFYEADKAHCLACGRCYLACPVEHKRLGRFEELEAVSAHSPERGIISHTTQDTLHG
jgi:NAD-dependent dihydropyrimidine dehydrogenase PreA subunit